MRTVIHVLLLCLLAALPAGGQERPDFSGGWAAATEAPPDLAAAPSPVFGQRFWLRQTGDTVIAVRTIRDKTIAATFPLNGQEVRTRIPGGLCQGDAESIEAAGWEATALAFTLVGSVPPGGGAPTTLAVKRLLHLRSADTLVVEGTVRDARGGQRQVGTLYRRSTDPMPAPHEQPAAQKTAAAIGQVAWISGVWIGTTGAVTVEERWTPSAGGSMLAIARTLRNGVMSSFEFLCIAERDGGLVYTAMPNGRTPPTDFRLTTVTADSATFENPAHDFPKLIRYARRPDGSLETTVSGDGKQKPQIVVLKKVE